ncbi:LysR substrate-binding domain-containing protein [Halomonas salipaludis]|uniref:LysR family transcriptional regulator n=1 Tax=Halomonas salipaludis TaxID=2032625 RepID=A0A2A2F0X3_9GAMM|nr:LysR substrate-binding domain-containing protein [Halomonas salipaludis]PAU78420.1 LysR family transcriptional regulator [Halomonas salipaludis]
MSRYLPPLNALKAFEAAAQCQNFTQAAQRLHVTQSAISRQVRHLEEQLGVVLFERRPGQLRLTEAGRRLLPALSTSFDRIALTVRDLASPTDLTRLRLNVPPTLASRWLVPRLDDLRRRYPTLSLTLTTRESDDLAADSTLDAAIRFGDGDWNDVEPHFLMQENHIAVCAPRLLRDGRPLDLREQTLLHVMRTTEDRFPTWRHWLDAAGIEGVDTQGGLEFDLLDLAIRAALEGLGITIADRAMVARELAKGALVQPLAAAMPGHQSYWFVTRPGQGDEPMLTLVYDWLQGAVASDGPSQRSL